MKSVETKLWGLLKDEMWNSLHKKIEDSTYFRIDYMTWTVVWERTWMGHGDLIIEKILWNVQNENY